MQKILIIFIILFYPFLILFGQPRPIQFSGLVVTGDSLYGIPNVNLSIRQAYRGGTTDRFGFFSFVVLEGDTVFISCVGFKTQKTIIPTGNINQSHALFVELEQDVTQLQEVIISPLPPKDKFVQAFLALQLPRETYDNFEKNYSQKILKKLFNEYAMDGSENYKTWSAYQFEKVSHKNEVIMNPLLNPFAWVKFIQAVSEGKFKRKKEDED
ncbi:MAG: hypothetical protein A3H98_12790 [Bacteroidetes bacterium RIFCSPLOWO2_02_FULL_36_8]|nr:MAG: hypothetical protein A3H98_12790 [Bacteroidetes bacterium RIFCSPLOWO2_02_FULL_36_8]OFY70668.1 MAG: hypothetical protein A3G23_08045 [Bacteroidetes bacterium RIFCSPLOWO2_12_FULL_37_12]